MPPSLVYATARGNWIKRNFVIQITKTPRISSSNRGTAAITNGFENRISNPEFVNCLLSGCARKVDSISEILEGEETESEITNKTPPEIDKDEGF
jgi:hypothetical protein